MKQYVVDAFTESVFHGNPAAVCVMDRWLSDDLMQQIAIENNLSETAFVVPEGDRYHIRWFTPGTEVDLCGHATLASAFVLTRFYDTAARELAFTSLSGEQMTTNMTSETVKAATIMVATIPILCIYPWLQKYFIHGVMVGAVKE